MPTQRRLEKFERVLRQKQPDLTVVLENIHDPHNVSAILRSCDAVGVQEVHLVYTDTLFPGIGKKSSASARKWIERVKHTSIDECYAHLRKDGFTVYATHIVAGSKSLYDLDLTANVALVFGNEHRGVSDEASAKADGNFLIPMVGMIQSLNVSVACAVSLFEAYRQRSQAGHYTESKLDPGEFDKLLKKWVDK
jgi:tRNA (guanosine-2'-O-)-methyltransferase